MRGFVRLTAALALAISCAAAAETWSGKVVGVIDGDTLDVMRDGVAQRVRLEQIDAPERGQSFGQAAKKVLSDAAFGETATVTEHDQDRYGRVVGAVAVDGNDMSRMMVERGYAWAYPNYVRDPAFHELQKDAERRGAGLWADEDPVPPWEWRKKK